MNIVEGGLSDLMNQANLLVNLKNPIGYSPKYRSNYQSPDQEIDKGGQEMVMSDSKSDD